MATAGLELSQPDGPDAFPRAKPTRESIRLPERIRRRAGLPRPLAARRLPLLNARRARDIRATAAQPGAAAASTFS